MFRYYMYYIHTSIPLLGPFFQSLQMAVRAVPYHKDFLVLLGSDGTADGNAAVTVHMADFARSVGEINSIINLFYQSHELDIPPVI